MMSRWIPEVVINNCKDAICKPISLREVLGDGKYFNNNTSVKKARGFIRTKDGKFHIVEKELSMGRNQYEFISGTDIAVIHIDVEYTATLDNGLTVTVFDKLHGNYDRKDNVLDLWSINGHTFQVLIEEDTDDEPRKKEEFKEESCQATTNNDSRYRIHEYHTVTADCIHGTKTYLFDELEKHDDMRIETITIYSTTAVYDVSNQIITKRDDGFITLSANLTHKINGKTGKIYGECTDKGVLSLSYFGKDIRHVYIGFTVSYPEKEVPSKNHITERNFLMGLQDYDVVVKTIKMGTDVDLLSEFVDRKHIAVAAVSIAAINSSTKTLFENDEWEGLENQEICKNIDNDLISIYTTVKNSSVKPIIEDTILGEYSSDGRMRLNSTNNIVSSVVIVAVIKKNLKEK